MKTFNHITEVGRGRLFHQLKSNGSREKLFLTTTEEWVLKKDDGRELLLPGSREALDWSLGKKLCSSRRAFLEHWVGLIRIPYRNVTPEVRLFPEETTDPVADIPIPSPCPTRRAQELIQHPIFNHCVFKHANGENKITLTPASRDKVVSMVDRIHETDYYVGTPVNFSDGSRIQHVSDGPNIEQFNFINGDLECTVACFAVFRGADLPYNFQTRTGDETTWIRVPDHCEILDEGTITQLITTAVAACVHYQINNSNIYGLDEHPLALHGLGCPELEQE